MSTPFDGAAARRIMSTEYGRHGHIEKGSFAARAQSAAAKNMNAGKVRAKTASRASISFVARFLRVLLTYSPLQVAGWEASATSGASKGSGGYIRGSGPYSSSYKS